MPAVTTANQVVREDISDAYLQPDVRKTPVQTRMKKGEKLKNVALFSWAIEKMDGRSTVGIPENKDVTSFESDQQFKLYNRSQKFWRTPHVTTEANEINVAPSDFGKYVKQVAKKVDEQRRDVETCLLGDGDSNDDTGLVGRQFMQLGRVINDTTSVGSSNAALTFGDSQTAIDPLFRTPTKQIYVGNLTDVNGAPVFNDEKLLDMLQSRFDNLGQTTELACFCDSVLKRHFSQFFGKYKPNVQGYTTVVRTEQEAITSKNFALYGVDLLETDFGPIDINLAQWMPLTLSTATPASAPSGRGYFLDMAYMMLRPSGKWMTHRELPDLGAGPRGLIESILGYEYGDPRGHCKVDPNVIQGT